MNELIQIYKERKQMYLKLFAEGKSWEEARQIIDKQDFEERIDKIVYPKGKKKEYKEEIGHITALYSILGSNLNCGGKYSCKKTDTTINGKPVYARIFIKRVGYSIYLGDNQYEYIFDNATEEELNDILNGKMSIDYK